MPKLNIERINKIKKNKYLNAFEIEYLDKSNNLRKWEMVSRGSLKRLKKEIIENKKYTDGVMVFAANKNKDKVVLLKEYRVTAGEYIYALPAGLQDENESVKITSKREFKEETGMDFKYMNHSKAEYTSVGLSNEKVNIAYGYFSGTPTKKFQEESEDAEILIVDKKKVKKLLEKKEFCIRTRLVLENFFNLNDFLNK
ncbi:MAG: NUDIX hydrolase [Bacillota bacterium]